MTTLPMSEPLEGLEKHNGAIIFDCDGTLVDTMGAHYDSWTTVLRQHGIEKELPYDIFCTWGGMAGDLVAREICLYLDADHLPEELAREKRNHFMSQDYEHPLVAPIADFARRVSETHPVAVVSGGNRPTVEKTLRHANLRNLFEVIVTPEDVTHGKPAPDMFLLAAEKLGVAPEDCLVFEDGPPGIEGALTAGMRVVVVGPAASKYTKEEARGISYV